MATTEMENHEHIRAVAEGFIQRHYFAEHVVFRKIWPAFEALIAQCGATFPDHRGLRNWVKRLPTGIGMSVDERADYMTPIVLATVTEVLKTVRDQQPTDVEMGALVSKVASRFGARGELLARLSQHLPSLCKAVTTAKMNVAEGFQVMARASQFEIWTEGEHNFVTSIEKYIKKKQEYLFWVDLHEDHTRSAQVLLELVKRIGQETRLEEILHSVWGDKFNVPLAKGVDDGKLEQQLTVLNKMSKNKFRDFIFRGDFGKTIGLKRSFAPYYFLYSQLH